MENAAEKPLVNGNASALAAYNLNFNNLVNVHRQRIIKLEPSYLIKRNQIKFSKNFIPNKPIINGLKTTWINQVDLTQRAQQIHTDNYTGYLDWMALQEAQYDRSDIILFHDHEKITRLLGGVLFVRNKQTVKWLWDSSIRSKTLYRSINRAIQTFINQQTEQIDLQAVSEINLTEWNEAHEVWGYHLNKGVFRFLQNKFYCTTGDFANQMARNWNS